MTRTLTLILLALLAWPVATWAASDQTLTFEAPSELLDRSKRDSTLREINAFGVDRVRALVYWKDFAPAAGSAKRPEFDATDPEAYPARTWDQLDGLFAAAAERKVSVQVTLTGPVPRWATRGNRDNVTEPDPDEFEAFATAVGRRYGEQVSVWSIWNEPNHPQFLRPQFSNGHAASPAIYRRLFLAGEAGLRASGNGDDMLLFGETAPRGTPNVVAPLAFLRGVLCLSPGYRPTRKCAKLPADGYAHHAYTTRAGPRFRPPDPDDVTIGVISRLTTALNSAAKAGAISHGLGIYLTEFGIQSAPDPIVGVSLARQASYLAMAEHIAFANPRVRSFSQYLLRDDLPRSGNKAARFSGFESGLRHSDGRPKPAYEGFRLPLAAESYGLSDVLWGRVRPLSARTEVTIQAQPAKGAPWADMKKVTTNSKGVFGLRAKHDDGQRYRVQWTAPDGKVWLGPPIQPSG
ncbi:MAG: hypothetical protein ACXW08_07425 [Solirubrobacteraceae bacterium]